METNNILLSRITQDKNWYLSRNCREHSLCFKKLLEMEKKITKLKGNKIPDDLEKEIYTLLSSSEREKGYLESDSYFLFFN